MIDNLPQLPEGLSWSVQSYFGNYEDGAYNSGSRVSVGIRKEGKFLFWKTNFYVEGVQVRLVDPRNGDSSIRFAAQDVFAAYIAFQVGKTL